MKIMTEDNAGNVISKCHSVKGNSECSGRPKEGSFIGRMGEVAEKWRSEDREDIKKIKDEIRQIYDDAGDAAKEYITIDGARYRKGDILTFYVVERKITELKETLRNCYSIRYGHRCFGRRHHNHNSQHIHGRHWHRHHFHRGPHCHGMSYDNSRMMKLLIEMMKKNKREKDEDDSLSGIQFKEKSRLKNELLLNNAGKN